jgi:allantoin racemase
MTLSLRIITPHTTPRPNKLPGLAALARACGVVLSQATLEMGPASVESAFDEALCAPDVVRRAIEGEQDGVDALIIDCMGDPALQATREAVHVPVFGPAETSMHVASMLGHRFAIVTVLDRVRPLIDHLATRYGVAKKLACVRSVETPVLAIGDDPNRLAEALFAEARQAILVDHADVIVLGCTGFAGLDAALKARLAEASLAVPVIDPLAVTFVVAAGLVRANLAHSKRAYPQPPGKRIIGFPELVRAADFIPKDRI